MTSPSIILIVDDLAANREMLVELLDSPDYQLVEAVDGRQALQLAGANPPDLVFLDVMMPEMDGFEVCRRFRSDPRLAEIPILLITALDDHTSRLAGLDAGADDFIINPSIGPSSGACAPLPGSIATAGWRGAGASANNQLSTAPAKRCRPTPTAA